MDVITETLHAAGLRVEEREGRGRVVVAARDFARGAVLVATAPRVAVLQFAQRTLRCAHCWKEEGDVGRLAACSRCKHARYCGAACQKAAWKTGGHRRLCKLLAAAGQLFKAMPEDVVDEVVLLLTLALVHGDGLQGDAQIMALESHAADVRSRTAQRWEETVQLAGLVHGLLPEADVDDVAEMLCRFQCNNFALWNGLLAPVAAGIFPVGAMVNHSCWPNAALAYDLEDARGTQTFHALRDIAAGEEICHSYLDMTVTTSARQAQLRDVYHFTCDCWLCSSDADALAIDARKTAVVVDDARVRGQADKLMEQADIALQQSSGASSETVDEATRWRLQLLGNCLELRLSVLGPEHLDVLRVASQLMTERMLVQDWAGSAAVCARICDIYRALLPPSHPLLGLQLFTLGDCAMRSGDERRAFAYHAQALDVLQASRGDDAETLQTLRAIVR